jgi:hypothetical protein
MVIIYVYSDCGAILGGEGGGIQQLWGAQSKGPQNEQQFNFLKPKTYFMYHQFNIQQFYVLSTQCIYVFCVDLRTNSDYFPI